MSERVKLEKRKPWSGWMAFFRDGTPLLWTISSSKRDAAILWRDSSLARGLGPRAAKLERITIAPEVPNA